MVCGFVHALLMALAFPPVGFWPSVLVAPMPLVWVAVRATRLNRAALLASLGVLPLWLFEMSYVIPISTAGYAPMTLYLACFTWIFVLPLGMVARAWPRFPLAIAVPVGWVAMEVLRGDVVLDGMPWFYLAHPLIDVPALALPARVVGVEGVSFLVAAFAGGLCGAQFYGGLPQRREAARWLAGTIAAWFAGTLVAGFAPGAIGDGQPIRVGIVQTNLPQNNKVGWKFERRLSDMDRFEDLTRRACVAGSAPDFIVWPETMFPGINLDEASLRAQERAGLYVPVPRGDGTSEKVSVNIFASRLFELQRSIGIPMVVGAIGADDPKVVERDGRFSIEARRRYNSVFIVNHGFVEPERFDKVALTPFGEYMPLIGRWPWMQDQLLSLGARGMTFDLASGTKFTPLVLGLGEGKPQVRFAAPICFEVTRAEHCRRLVFEGSQRRANLLINLTNDGWFTFFGAGRLQHLQLARWRCLELGTPMVRAANTGVSAMIDSRGRVIASGIDGHSNAADVDGVLSGVMPNIVEDTPYARFGDWVSYPVLAIAGVTTVVAWFMDRRRPRGRMRESAN